jgi:hypothetical protein
MPDRSSWAESLAGGDKRQPPSCVGAICVYARIFDAFAQESALMSRTLNLTAALIVTLAAVACSSTPKQPAASTSTAAPSAAATKVATSSAPSATSTATDPAQPDARLVSQGYKAVKFKNDYVYCRMESVTGTQFKKRICLSAEAIRDLEQKTQETTDSMTKQRTGPACFPGTNC